MPRCHTAVQAGACRRPLAPPARRHHRCRLVWRVQLLLGVRSTPGADRGGCWRTPFSKRQRYAAGSLVLAEPCTKSKRETPKESAACRHWNQPCSVCCLALAGPGLCGTLRVQATRDPREAQTHQARLSSAGPGLPPWGLAAGAPVGKADNTCSSKTLRRCSARACPQSLSFSCTARCRLPVSHWDL